MREVNKDVDEVNDYRFYNGNYILIDHFLIEELLWLIFGIYIFPGVQGKLGISEILNTRFL